MLTKTIKSSLLAAVCGLSVSGAASGADLVFGVGNPPSSLDPHYANLNPNVQIAKHIWNTLVDFDEKFQLKPSLAESWKPIDDTTWEFKLRKGVKFHDGSDFTADDVIFTFARVPKVQSPSPMTGMIGDKVFKKIDDYTVHVTTKEPYPLAPNDMTRIVIISSELGENVSTGDFNSGKAAIGTGPFKFVDWKQGDNLLLEANPNYWGGKPKWDRVTVKPISSGPSRVSALLSGDVDIIDFVPPADVAKLRTDNRYTLHQTPGARTIYIHLDSNRDISPQVRDNEGKPLFPNPLRNWEVRKALSMAIDRKAIAERLMDGLAVPAGQMIPEGGFGFNPDVKPEKHDPDEAKKLLAKVGLPSGFQITIHGPNDRYINDGKIAETVAQMWTRIGVKTQVDTMPGSAFFGRATKLEFSAIVVGYQTDSGEMSAAIREQFHTFNREKGYGVLNRGRYSNERVDQILASALKTVDDGKRAILLKEGAEIAANDVALLPIHYEVNTWASRKGLTYKARTDAQTLLYDVSQP